MGRLVSIITLLFIKVFGNKLLRKSAIVEYETILDYLRSQDSRHATFKLYEPSTKKPSQVFFCEFCKFFSEEDFYKTSLGNCFSYSARSITHSHSFFSIKAISLRFGFGNFNVCGAFGLVQEQALLVAVTKLPLLNGLRDRNSPKPKIKKVGSWKSNSNSSDQI